MKSYKLDGLWYYTELPQGMRIAVKRDFFTVDGSFIEGINFLILGEIHNEYEAHRTSTIHKFKDYEHFLASGRMYIKA